MVGQPIGKSVFVKHNYIFVQLVEIKICFDVTSHFIFIPKHLAETALSQLWNDLNSCLKNEHRLDILKLCMLTFFTFCGVIHLCINDIKRK